MTGAVYTVGGYQHRRAVFRPVAGLQWFAASQLEHTQFVVGAVAGVGGVAHKSAAVVLHNGRCFSHAAGVAVQVEAELPIQFGLCYHHGRAFIHRPWVVHFGYPGALIRAYPFRPQQVQLVFELEIATVYVPAVGHKGGLEFVGAERVVTGAFQNM